MYNNFLRRLYLFSVIDSLHPGRNRSENFIRDCIEFFCDFGDGQLFSEYFNSVTRFTIYIGYIDHAYVHTNIAYDGSCFPFTTTHPFPFPRWRSSPSAYPMGIAAMRESRDNTPFLPYPMVSPADSVLI